MMTFNEDTAKGYTVIIMDRSEGRALITALETITDPVAGDKPLRKSSKAWKIAKKLTDSLCCW